MACTVSVPASSLNDDGTNDNNKMDDSVPMEFSAERNGEQLRECKILSCN